MCSMRTKWSVYGLVVCGLLVYSMLCIPSARVSSAPISEQDASSKQEVIAPEAPFNMEPDAGALARELSAATGQASIVVLTNTSALDAVNCNAVYSWREAVPVLQRAGVTPVFFEQGPAVGLVQGRTYPASKTPNQSCPFYKSWVQFWNGYEKLSPEQRKSFISAEGLVVPTNLLGLPTDLQMLIKSFAALPQANTRTNYQLRITLNPAVFTSFPDAPHGKTTGNWKWGGWLLKGNLKFPQSVVLPRNFHISQRASALLNKTLVFDSSTISAQKLRQELERVGAGHIKVAEDVELPTLGIAKGTLTIGLLLRCLKMAAIAEPRYLEGENLLFIGPPVFVDNLLGTGGMSSKQQQEFFRLLSVILDRSKIDIGPLSRSVFLIPTKSLPEDFIKTLLSDEPPIEAYRQEGIPTEGVGEDAQHKALSRWLTVYKDSPALVLPTISLTVAVEEEQLVGKHKMWLANTVSDTILSPACPAGE